MQRSCKAIESKCFQYSCKHVSRRCESYMMYFENDSPHQTVMIVCECIWSSYIITLHIMIYLCSLAKVSHKTHIRFATLDTIVQEQCDLTFTRNTCGIICSLNCLYLFLKWNWLDMFSVFWSRNALHLELRLCFCA